MQRSATSMLAVAGLITGMVMSVGVLGPLPARAEASTSAAQGQPTVIGARLGLHPDKTRFVLELSQSVSFQTAVRTDPPRVEVDLPELAWPGAEAPKAGTGLIRSYHIERPASGGVRLVLLASGLPRVIAAMALPPAEGHQTRLVFDLAPAAPASSRSTSAQGAAGRPVTPPVTQPAPVQSASSAPTPVPPPPVVAASAPLTPKAAPSAPTATAPPIQLVPPAPSRSAPPPTPPLQSQPQSQSQSQPSPSTLAPQPPPVVRPSAPLTDHAAPLLPQRPPAQMAAAVAAPPAPHPLAVAKPRRPGAARPMIALDPGHGGVDPGATGINGIHEKDITLATAREVQRQLEASGRYRVILTREDDEFVPLRERVSRARQAGADLFISMHADSISRSEIRGLSIYTLSDKASDHEAEMLAAKENRADAIGGIDLSHENDQVATILIDLAQRDTRNHSRRFATMVLRDVGRNLTLLTKPDRSAGFAVLTAPDVPSVLIEMGYLSSAEDASLLTQPQHRQRLAAALVHAIDGYFNWLGGGRRS